VRQVGILLAAVFMAVTAVAVAAPNVRMDAIVVPSGMVDSGDIIDPIVVIRNNGTVLADSFDVYLMIDNEMDRMLYRDSVVLLNVPPGEVDTVYLSRWVPEGRDSVGTLAWVYWQEDVVHSDDTIYERFLVRARNVGITNIYVPTPHDTIPPDTIRPRVRVFNYSNVYLTFPVVFSIDDWSDTVMVTNMSPFGSRSVTADPWYADSGDFEATITVVVEGDLHPEDNERTFPFYVRPGAGIEERDTGSEPKGFSFGPAGPNHFVDAARLAYSLPVGTHVDLAIYSACGRRVHTLQYGMMPAGQHMVVWDGRDDRDSSAAPGIYLVHLEADGYSRTRKLVKLD
jgi:hypothetical protein